MGTRKLAVQVLKDVFIPIPLSLKDIVWPAPLSWVTAYFADEPGDDYLEPGPSAPAGWTGPKDSEMRVIWKRERARTENGRFWMIANEHDRALLSAIVDDFFYSVERGEPDAQFSKIACIESDEIRHAMCDACL